MQKKDSVSVFDIKRFAVHDGPGIRTTVFLKGCNLFCPWCQNPEGISRTKNLLFQKNKCIECHSCVKLCPQNAIGISSISKIEIDREACNLCGECVENCPTTALSFDSREYMVSELVQELERDVVFYEESNGGVTFSGGEPLLQIENITAIACQLKKKNIHIVVESALMVSQATLKKALEFVDLFLIDMKILTREQAWKTIGMDLDLCKRNLEFLFASGVEINCRIPLIPGYTDSTQNLKNIKTFISELNSKYKRNVSIELINFNPLSKIKYRQMGQEIPAIKRWSKYSNNEFQNLYTILNDE